MRVPGALRSVAGGGLARTLRALDPVYQIVSPECITLSVGGDPARFDGDGVLLYEDRYAYPLASERRLIERLRAEIRPGDVFWDVGASLGLYAVFVGLELTDGAVVAFEPFPDDAALTRRNLRLNRIEARGRVLPLALGKEDRTAWLEAAPAKTGRRLVEDGDGAVPVVVAPGDAAVDRYDLPTPDVMKIDVEGAEGAVIDGLERVLRRSPPRSIYCEIHRSKLTEFGGSRDAVLDALADHGFEVETLGGRREAEFVRCVR
jgi:FkbM family methyltransferase